MTTDPSVGPMKLRYDHWSGAEVAVPAWVPDAYIELARRRDGSHQVLLNVCWEGGGWFIAGTGATELAAANDLVRRLSNLKP